MQIKKVNKEIWFNINKVLEKDCLVNIIYGGRGIGKTYSCLKYAYEHYFKTGYGTIYLRRFKEELKDFQGMLNNIIADGNIDGSKIKFEKGKKFIDIENNNRIIQAMPLSTAVTKKSNDFSDIDTIIYDEFIIANSNYQYIPDEFKTFHNFYETIARLREITQGVVVKAILLANPENRNNPYFIGYNIPLNTKKLYIKDDLLVLHADSHDFMEIKKTTRWGKFISTHTNMEEYIEGNFKNNNEYLIDKLPQHTTYIATFIYLETKIGVYRTNDHKIILSKKYNEQNKNVFALTKADRTPDYQLLDKKNPYIMHLIMYNKAGQLFFDDYKIQAIFFDILKLL